MSVKYGSMNQLSLFSDVSTMDSLAVKNRFSSIRNQNDKMEFLRRLSKEYLREFGIKKIVIAVYNEDGSHKTLYLRGDMVARDFLVLAMEKNFPQVKLIDTEVTLRGHVSERLSEMILTWQLYEVLGDFENFNRPIQDHENIVEIYESWPEKNDGFKFLLKENPKKYDCIKLLKMQRDYIDQDLNNEDQMKYLLPIGFDVEKPFKDGKGNLLKEIVKTRGYTTDGILWIKKAGKPWRKRFCFISMGNLFFSRNGKSTNSKDMALLFDVENGYSYTPRNKDAAMKFSNITRSPTPFIILFRSKSHFHVSPNDVSAICVKSEEELRRWSLTLILLKFGWKKICDDYTVSNDMKNYRHLSDMGSVSTRNSQIDMKSLKKRYFRRTPLQETMLTRDATLTKSESSLFANDINEAIESLNEATSSSGNISLRHDKLTKERNVQLLGKNPNTKIVAEGEEVLYLYSESFPSQHAIDTSAIRIPKRHSNCCVDKEMTSFPLETLDEERSYEKRKDRKIKTEHLKNINETEAKVPSAQVLDGPFKNCQYYHGLINIDDTGKYLKNKGDFMIHESSAKPDEERTYLTCIIEDGSIAHIEITVAKNSDTKYMMRLANKGDVFSSIYDLITYYKTNPHMLPIKMKLNHAIIRKTEENQSDVKYTIIIDSKKDSLKLMRNGLSIKEFVIIKLPDNTVTIDGIESSFSSIYKLAVYAEDNISTLL